MVAHCEVKPGIRSAVGTLDTTELNRRRWGAFDFRTKAWFAARQESAEGNKATLHTVTPYIWSDSVAELVELRRTTGIG
jgi:hypothetical protein